MGSSAMAGHGYTAHLRPYRDPDHAGLLDPPLDRHVPKIKSQKVMMRSVMILQCGFGEAMYVDNATRGLPARGRHHGSEDPFGCRWMVFS